MTLFRKVFQNQSRPAGADEALDEDELRAAFLEIDAQNDLLILEPFRCGALDDASVAASPQDEERAATETVKPLKMIEDALPDKLTSNAGVPEDTDTEQVSIEEDACSAKGTDIGAAVQSDEEIAACLDRALAADPVALSEVEKKISDDVDGEPHAQADSAFMAEEPEEVRPPDIEGDEAVKRAPAVKEGKAFSIDQLQVAAQVDVSLSRDEAANTDADQNADVAFNAVPAPATGRAGRRAGRVKTRLLGFSRGEDEADPFCRASKATATAQPEKFPVGWLVIVEGPGVGHSFSIFAGASMIGRGEDQVIRLDFGDNSISRHNHAAIAYDEEDNKFYIGHGGKSNIIRRNARPVLSTEELNHADLIRIGETTLRFVALCGSDFRWSSVERPDAPGA